MAFSELLVRVLAALDFLWAYCSVYSQSCASDLRPGHAFVSHQFAWKAQLDWLIAYPFSLALFSWPLHQHALVAVSRTCRLPLASFGEQHTDHPYLSSIFSDTLWFLQRASLVQSFVAPGWLPFPRSAWCRPRGSSCQALP